ncbi:hypothetical protein [Pseudochrobactrum sp. MP213Fo]|uniref:hypothetical protein n=1 Tax=Pseudochrobactrum sp. MP213Fo TaxID=3022250 RepID=UPI003B9F22D7
MQISQTIPLKAYERIIFERAEYSGTRYYDPVLTPDATYADAITAAGYRTIAIYRLDTSTQNMKPIIDEVAFHYQPDGSMEFPRWVMNSVRFGDIMAQAHVIWSAQHECF